MEENAYLIFGCYGRVDSELVLCSSTENRILKLDDSLERFSDIVDYFENLRLFDRPIMDHNALRHLIFNLQRNYYQNTRPIWTETKFNALEKYLNMHKMCGVYASLIVSCDDKKKPEPKDDRVFVEANKPETKKPHLTLIGAK